MHTHRLPTLPSPKTSYGSALLLHCFKGLKINHLHTYMRIPTSHHHTHSKTQTCYNLVLIARACSHLSPPPCCLSFMAHKRLADAPQHQSPSGPIKPCWNLNTQYVLPALIPLRLPQRDWQRHEQLGHRIEEERCGVVPADHCPVPCWELGVVMGSGKLVCSQPGCPSVQGGSSGSILCSLSSLQKSQNWFPLGYKITFSILSLSIETLPMYSFLLAPLKL